MKKLSILLVSIILMLSLSGCMSRNSAPVIPDTAATAEKEARTNRALEIMTEPASEGKTEAERGEGSCDESESENESATETETEHETIAETAEIKRETVAESEPETAPDADGEMTAETTSKANRETEAQTEVRREPANDTVPETDAETSQESKTTSDCNTSTDCGTKQKTIWDMLFGGKPGSETEQNGAYGTHPDKETQTAQKTEPTLPGNDTSEYSDFATEVTRLVNEIRRSYGLSQLTLDDDLSKVAQAKSQDMHDVGYFAHESPTYGTPFEMMRSFGITYRAAGENIAKGFRTPESVVDAWMNSEGHRANILSPKFSRIGIGYVADGGYWTQMFTG